MLSKRANSAIHYLTAKPQERTVNVTKEVWSEILLERVLEAPIKAQGSLFDIKAQHLGVDVYRLRLVPR